MYTSRSSRFPTSSQAGNCMQQLRGNFGSPTIHHCGTRSLGVLFIYKYCISSTFFFSNLYVIVKLQGPSTANNANLYPPERQLTKASGQLFDLG